MTESDRTDDRVDMPALDLATNTATFTTWIRRDGSQTPWAGLVFSRAGSTTAGHTARWRRGHRCSRVAASCSRSLCAM